MNTPRQSSSATGGFTLLEMTIVILVLVTLIGIGLFSYRRMDEWKLGRQASETLRDVYSAQRMFLADNPTTPVASLTAANIIPYLPGQNTVLPTIESMEGTNLGILVNVSPPVINNGAGVAYDPSDDNRDSLWDVGE